MPSPPLMLLGTVTSLKDEEKLGRVQVTASLLGQSVILGWLRVLQPIASAGTGFFVLPEKDDQVVVLCGDGNHPDGMVVLGAVYHGAAKPPVPEADDTNKLKALHTKGGTKLVLSDEKGKEAVSVETKDAKIKIVLDGAKTTILVEADKDIAVESKTAAISLKAKELSLEATDGVTIKGKALTMTATDKAALKGTNGTDIGGASVTVKADNAVEVEGLTAKVVGKTSAAVEGAAIALKGMVNVE